MYCLKLNCVKFNFIFYSNPVIDITYNINIMYFFINFYFELLRVYEDIKISFALSLKSE